MISIILCDDDAFILKLASERIAEEIQKGRLDARIAAVTQDAKELFQFLGQNPGSYLCFLDLDFGSGRLNGIDIARKLKAENAEHKIVFVTNHQEMALQVLKSGVEPFGFLEKSTDMKALGNGFGKYIRMACNAMPPKQKEEAEIRLHLGLGETLGLSVAQLTYVETEKMVSHGITYHTADHSAITVRDTMEHVSELLGEEFIRCHRGILVNKRYITDLENGMIRLANGIQIPCSFRMKGEIRKWLISQRS
ncbi:MAG: LytR/AlgR family response regulator transcription factor [Lachnospiraceae bacterium]|jgi:two-component system response regulator AgrA